MLRPPQEGQPFNQMKYLVQIMCQFQFNSFRKYIGTLPVHTGLLFFLSHRTFSLEFGLLKSYHCGLGVIVKLNSMLQRYKSFFIIFFPTLVCISSFENQIQHMLFPHWGRNERGSTLSAKVLLPLSRNIPHPCQGGDKLIISK